MHKKLTAIQWLSIATILPLLILLIGDWTASVYHIHLFNDAIYWLIYAIIGLPCFYFASLKWYAKPLIAILTTLGMWLGWGALMIVMGLLFHVQMGWSL